MTEFRRPYGFTAAAVAVALSPMCMRQVAAQPDSDRALVDAYNATGLALLGRVLPVQGNAVISPYSIGTAMSMAAAGAQGETAAEMLRVLRHTLSQEQMTRAHGSLAQAVSGTARREGVALSVANALCLTQHGTMVTPAYRALLRQRYGAELFEGTDVGPINRWVTQATHGKIERVLDRLSPNSVCVLLNAVYFKGLWLSQFDPKLTRPAPFTLASGEVVSVPTMRQTGRFPLHRGRSFQAISLPYQGGGFCMVVAVPSAADGVAELERLACTGELSSLLLRELPETEPTKVRLELPRFRTAFGVDLIPPFKQMGMSHAFSLFTANFAGITGDDTPGLVWIAQIRHEAVLEVDEKGSEAAAASAVEIKTRSASRTPVFRADRPFLLFIVEKRTGAILLAGRIINPLLTG